MKFLKVLVNSLLTGFFLSALIALLVLDLNINLTFSLLPFLQFSLYLMPVYGLAIALAGLIFFFILQFFAGRSLKIAPISPGFLTVGFTVVTLVSLFIMRENFRHFAALFSPEVQSLLNRQSITLAFLAALGLMTAFASLAYRKRVFFYTLYFLLLSAGIGYVVLQRARYPRFSPPETVATLNAQSIEKRLTIIGMEGLSIDLLITLITQNKLPNFNFLIENGCWGTLANFTPNEMLVLDTSFNTGKLPSKHRRLSASEFVYLNLRDRFQVVPRFIFFKQMERIGLLAEHELIPPKLVMDIWDIFEANGTAYVKRDWPLNREETAATPDAESAFNRIYEDLRFENGGIFGKVKEALCTDFVQENLVTQAKEEIQPRLVYFLLPGLDKVKTYFYRYTYPEMFGEVDQEVLTRFSTVIERYYQYYDEIIGKYLAAKKDDELLVVYSPHGVEVVPMWKRIAEWMFGDPQVSGYHENAPDGVIFFIGKDIAANRNIQDMHLIDVAPTLLHYLGLPVGKDMDGVVNSAVFSVEFKSEPVLYISSYEEHNIEQTQ
jgi:hypothetical protein